MADSIDAMNPSMVPYPPKKRKRNPTSSTGPKKPRSKPVECPVCLTARSPHLVHVIQKCGCTYCTFCIREMFSIGISGYPAICCDFPLDFDLWTPQLPPQLRKAYKMKIEEGESSTPLYCGNSTCRKFVSGESIKDGFGSCGKCKMKTCIEENCNKTRAEHLGIHAICPDDLESEELKTLAEEKGWKRCPKCYALTERIRGCDDVRCICRTEWCYKCGKGIKGTKDVCLCHPPPPPRPVPPPAQDDVQIQKEVITIRDDDDTEAAVDPDVDMPDVKPSIEGIEGASRSVFYTDADLMAEVDRRAGAPENSSRHAEADVVAELDNLAAPNSRVNGSSRPRTAERASAADSGVPTFARGSTAHSTLDTLEDMLQAFNDYEATLPNPAPDVLIIDLENVENVTDKHISEHTGKDPSEVTSVSMIGAAIDATNHSRDADHEPPKPPRYCHTPAPNAIVTSNTANPSTYQGRDATSSITTCPDSNTETIFREPKVSPRPKFPTQSKPPLRTASPSLDTS